jgi:hypothetical protein
MPDTAPVPESLRLNFEQLAQRLAAPASVAVGTSSQIDAEDLRFQLALRGRCQPLQFIPKDVPPEQRISILSSVAPDCDVLSGRGWWLLDAVRRRVLAAQGVYSIEKAILEIRDAASDDVTKALRRLYLGPQADPDTLETAELQMLIAASTWTEKSPFRFDPAELNRIVASRSRRDEYQRFVAPGVFGRDEELGRLARFFDAPLGGGPSGRPEFLHIFGSGGIGKSTLIARAALTLLQEDRSAVLVHLDFDRTSLDCARLSTLDLELLRQAGLVNRDLQLRLSNRMDRIRKQFAGESGEDYFQMESSEHSSRSALDGALYPLHELGRPLLLILDTFEQVEAGGWQSVGGLKAWLEAVTIESGAREVRVLISGRSDPREGSFPEAKDDEILEIGDLLSEGARQMLVANGVPADVAPVMESALGGNPLVLKLASLFFSNIGGEETGRLLADVRAGQMPAALAQAFLYDRFLKHVPPPADNYVHPGLVLPEITKDLIRYVLGPEQGNDTITPQEVDEVFDALKNTKWLVTVSPQGAITQRRDLRQLMLKLIRSDPSRADRITRVRHLAIAYHASRPEPEHQAFAAYHRLMGVEESGDLAQFSSTDFGQIATFLRPHLDDLPKMARSYVQSRLLANLGAEEALKTLPDEEWSRYLAGDGINKGEGDRLVQGSDPMIALDLWRRRPARMDGQLPLFVLQALTETGEWEDPAREGALKALSTLGTDPESTERLFWLTRLQLLRLKPLSGLHIQCLTQVFGGDRPEQMALTAVAEAFGERAIINKDTLRKGDFASEPRLYLVHANRLGEPVPWLSKVSHIVTIQRDWSQRVMAGMPLAWGTRLWTQIYTLDRALSKWMKILLGLPLWQRLFRIVGSTVPSEANRAQVMEHAQHEMDACAGSSLDLVSSSLRSLSDNVLIDLENKTPAALALVFRGLTPEFHRPVRQALCEALTKPEQVQTFITDLRPAFSICPQQFEPETFARRALREPAVWFLSLAQFADRARVMETLLEAALRQAPEHEKLRRVRDAWIAWDRAICRGLTSDWLLSQTMQRSRT